MNDTSEHLQVPKTARGNSGPAILQVLPSLGEGGAERGTLDLARQLVNEGWRSLVASNGGPGEAEIEEHGSISLRLPLDRKNPFVVRANVRRLQRLIRTHAVQLVHARSRVSAWSAYYAAKRCNVPFVTTFHGVYDGSEGLLKRRYNQIMTRGDRVIAVSSFVAEHVKQRYRVPDERIRVIQRGIDVNEFDPDVVAKERIDALRTRWQVPAGLKVIMLPGRVVRRKGHRLLLRALELLERRNFICLMVGGFEPGSHFPGEVEGLIGAMDLRNVARLVGSCDDMPAALMLADVVVVPSTGVPEPFGRVSIEAQAMGKPVVVTDSGGLSETLMPAATGWLVRPDDPAELAQAIGLALSMPDDVRARLAVRARRFVIRNFRTEQMGAKTMALYRELIEGRAPDAEEELVASAA